MSISMNKEEIRRVPSKSTFEYEEEEEDDDMRSRGMPARLHIPPLPFTPGPFTKKVEEEAECVHDSTILKPDTAGFGLSSRKNTPGFNTYGFGYESRGGKYIPRTSTALNNKEIPYEALVEEKQILRTRNKNEPTYWLRRYNYVLHRKRVVTVRPVVDTHNPSAPKNVYSTTTPFNRKLANFTRIEKENTILCKKIANLMSGKSQIDNVLAPNTKCIRRNAKERLSNLMKITYENVRMVKRLAQQKTEYSRNKLLSDYESSEDYLYRISRYPLYRWKKVPKAWKVYEELIKINACRNPHPLVYFDISLKKRALGRIIFQLRSDVVPYTAENFRMLCTGETGVSYLCSDINRIYLNMFYQGGDLSKKRGKTCSIYGTTFEDENFDLKHDCRGTLSMANNGPNSNGTQFLITAKALPCLDRTNVVFGKVLTGFRVLEVLDNADESAAVSIGSGNVIIIGCGELPPDTDLSSYYHDDLQLYENEEGDEEEEEESNRDEAVEDEFDEGMNEVEEEVEVEEEEENDRKKSGLERGPFDDTDDEEFSSLGQSTEYPLYDSSTNKNFSSEEEEDA